jgi:hypothetical protein
MESFIFEALSKQIIASGIPAVMLLAAILWFHKQWVKSQGSLETQQQARLDMQNKFIEALNTERNERIALIEAHHAECEKDRTDLRRQMLEYYKSAAQVVKAAGQSSQNSNSIPPTS